MTAAERALAELLARGAVLHERMQHATGERRERLRAERDRLRPIGIALENVARARYGMPRMEGT